MAKRLVLPTLFVVSIFLAAIWAITMIDNFKSAIWVPSVPGFRRESVAKLDQRCHRSKKQNGFGIVHLQGTIKVINQKGRITIPCQVYLKNGSNLIVYNSDITTQKLVIYDEKDTKKANQVNILKSQFTGPNAGLLVVLHATGSKILVDHSRFDYPLSITLGVGSDDVDTKSQLNVYDSYFRSVWPRSQGITVVSTGHGSYFNNQFILTDQQRDFALVLATHCHAANNYRASPKCQLN